MALHTWRHRSDRRIELDGTAVLQQGSHRGLLGLVDASTGGLCLQGPLKGIDRSQPVTLDLSLRGESVQVVGRLCWHRSTAVTAFHGWSLVTVPTALIEILGEGELCLPIALPDEDMEVNLAFDHDARFGRLLGTG